MQTAVDGLRASLHAALVAQGMPEDAAVTFVPEPPVGLRVVAVCKGDAWFGAQSEGSAPFVKKAESDNERVAAARAVELARLARLPLPSHEDPGQTATEHQGVEQEATPDDPTNNSPWRLQHSEPPEPPAPPPKKKTPPPPSARETLKALTAQLERMLPQTATMHPLEKSFLLSSGHDADVVDRGEIAMTPTLRREYTRWLAKYARDVSAQMVRRTR